ncbi:MAG: hypothetical protein KAQ93_08790 [Spirochaetales bacterium]|nr:hypothetical protein [Spirochaetales bacterium]
MFLEDIDNWLGSLSEPDQLQVFQALSEYLSVNELKNVMLEVSRGRSLLSIHRGLGLVKKYYVDLLRIQRLRIL